MKELRLKDICKKGSSSLKQKNVEKLSGQYPVYGASGQIASMDSYHQENDYIAIVKDGSGIGRVMFLPAKSSVIGTMQYILPKEGYDIHYIGYCLQSLGLSSYKQGAAIPHIYFRDYGERLVHVEENIDEQKAIVAKLDAAFAKIEKVKQSAIDQLNETVNLYQAILRDSFKPQKSWKERSIKELGETKVGPFGSLLHQKDYVEGGIPLVNPMHIAHGHIITDSKHCVSLEKYKELSSYVLKGGDIVIGRRGEMGRCAQVTEKENGFLCGTGSIFFRPNKKLVNTEFLTVLLCSDAIKKEMESLSGGATMMNLSSKALVKLTVTIPDVDVQREIMGNISTINNILESVTENASKIYADCEYLKESILRETFI